MKRVQLFLYVLFLCVGMSIVFSTIKAEKSDFAGSLHDYMWANYHQFSRNAQQAHNWYSTVLSNTSSLYTYKGYLHFLFDTGNYKAVVQLMPKTNTLFESDPDIQLLFARALRGVHDKKRADELIISLSNKFKTNIEIVYEAVQIYVERKELENALIVMDDVLNNSPKKPNFFIFHFLKAQIYAQLQKYTDADLHIQRCLESNPHFDKCWLLQGVIKEQQGDIQEAIKGYSSYLASAQQPDKRIAQHVLGLSLRLSQEAGKNVMGARGGSAYEKALTLFKNKQYQQALAQINNHLQGHDKWDKHDKIEAQLMKVHILFALKDYKQATSCLVEWLEKEPKNTQLHAVLHLLARSGAPMALVVNAFEHMHQKFPQELLPALYLADLYTRMGKSAQALTYHERALVLVQDKELASKIRLGMALIQYEAARFDDMRSLIEKIDAYTAAFGPAANLLAYYYVAHNNDPKKAQEWLDRACKTSCAQNPHFLDTQALIYYKQKKYDQALALLKKLETQAPQDALILIHLSKTHYKMGSKKEAIEVMQRAQQYAYSAYEKETAKKLLSQWGSVSHAHN